jgi:hypothetical protein
LSLTRRSSLVSAAARSTGGGPVETADGKSFRRTTIEFPSADAALKCLGDPQFLKDNSPGGPVSLLEIIAAEQDGPPST